MPVQIILSSKQIELDDKNLGVLNIKPTFSGITEPTAIFFKVKTNMKDLVQVRPSFGLIQHTIEDDSIATMNIKYVGELSQLKKVKLQFSWVWGPLTRVQVQKIAQPKLHHNDFKELYDGTKQKMGNQKIQMLLFTSKYQAKESQQSLIINQEQKQPAENDSDPEEEIQNQKESLSKTAESSALRQKSVQKQERTVKKGEAKGVSGVKVIILVLISFVLGVYLGIKLEDVRLNISSGYSLLDKISQAFPMKNQSNSKEDFQAENKSEEEKVQIIDAQL